MSKWMSFCWRREKVYMNWWFFYSAPVVFFLCSLFLCFFNHFKSKFLVCCGVQGIQRHKNSLLRWYNRQLWMDVLLFFRKKGSGGGVEGKMEWNFLFAYWSLFFSMIFLGAVSIGTTASSLSGIRPTWPPRTCCPCSWPDGCTWGKNERNECQDFFLKKSYF